MECHRYLRNVQDILADGKTPYGSRGRRSRNKVSVGEPAVISVSFSTEVLLVELADRIEDCLSSL